MKLTLNREQLLTPLQQIVGVIEKRQTMPILSNVLIEVNQNQLKLTGTDLEIQMVANLAVDEAESGGVTVPARKFLDLCRLLPAESEINIELQEDKVKLVSGRSRFVLSTLPAENYPEFAEADWEHEFAINAGQLRRALEKTIFCMAHQDVRYYLNGLMLNISNHKLKWVASDGHRLSMYHDEIEVETGLEQRIIIPRKGVLELFKLLNNSEAELKVQFSSNNIRIEIDNLVFSAKLVDATYPDFSKVFQKTFFPSIHLSKQRFKESLTRVSVLANEKFKGVTFDIHNDLLKITANNPDHDEAEEELVIDYQGEAMTIAFNASYLLDAVANLDADVALLNIANDVSTCFIQEPNQEAFKFIVMPMRL